MAPSSLKSSLQFCIGSSYRVEVRLRGAFTVACMFVVVLEHLMSMCVSLPLKTSDRLICSFGVDDQSP